MATLVHEPAYGLYEANSHTTYRDNYIPYGVRPYVKQVYQPHSLELKAGLKEDRYKYEDEFIARRHFPLIPVAPKRPLYLEFAPAAGLGCKDIDLERYHYIAPCPFIFY